MRIFVVGLFAMLLSACTAFSPQPQLLYGLSGDQLTLLGQRLGYRVEALGVDDYSFIRGKYVFHVIAHTDISVSRRIQADGPVLIVYQRPGRVPPVESRLSVEQGVTLARVEDHFRRFLREVGLPTDTSAIQKSAIPWTRETVVGLDIELVDPAVVLQMSFTREGHVPMCIGQKGGPLTAPMLYWKIVGGRLRILNDQGGIDDELTLLSRQPAMIVVQRRSGEIVTFDIHTHRSA